MAELSQFDKIVVEASSFHNIKWWAVKATLGKHSATAEGISLGLAVNKAKRQVKKRAKRCGCCCE